MKRLLTTLLLTTSVAGTQAAADCGKQLVDELSYLPTAAASRLNDELLLQTDAGPRPLKQLEKPPYLLHFWASWCRPCRPELQEMAEHYQQISATGLPVVPVSIDINGLATVQQTLAQLGIADTLPAYADPDSALFQASGGQVLPMTVLVNAEGRISHQFNGSTVWSHPAYQQRLGCPAP